MSFRFLRSQITSVSFAWLCRLEAQGQLSIATRLETSGLLMSFASHDLPSLATLPSGNSLEFALRVGTLKIAELLHSEVTGELSSDSAGPDPEQGIASQSRLKKRLQIVAVIKRQIREANIEVPQFVEDMGTESKPVMTKRPWETEVFRARSTLRLLVQLRDDEQSPGL